ncbi:GtrA family protein [Phyllobacterium bourgognense]|uniref:Putative flippase GtrA n=1 Tax=Phyllobacterium bourgognense TaxID=314236 RepID=A0A368YFU5_9HYPH|nr:GtrA family protein [Phyllobacterium bourgognense]RCW79111.1 putative flippase GtrA [Phyllobacterium bourgognense]
MSTQSNRPFDYLQIVRFASVGVLNTAFGYTVILFALWLGTGDIVSNLIGYTSGLALSFGLNNRWTFGSTKNVPSNVVARYVGTFLVAYAVNLGIVLAARSTGLMDGPMIHLLGICAYTILFYLGSVCFVFAENTPISIKNRHANQPTK